MSEVTSERSEAARRINSARDLAAYLVAYELVMEIFELSKHFPREERYALTIQIRNSSVCLNVWETCNGMMKKSSSFLLARD
jgi:23S rRNA-intervening sequence protein